jgi:hypothetical protein
MSFYNTLFGRSPLAPALLKILGLTSNDIPRYRDAYLNGDGTRIVIYTRTGGGNRAYHNSEESCRSCYPDYFTGEGEDPTGPWNSDLQAHPQFVTDYDDSFDSTYAYFEFKVPDEWADDLKALATQQPGASATPSEKWQALFASLQDPSTPA